MQKISANLFAEIIAVVVPAISKLITHKETEVKKEDLAYTKGYFPWLLCRRICQGLTIGVSAWTFDAKIKGFSYCNLFFWKLKSTPFRCYWSSQLLFFIRWLFAMGGTIFYLCLFFFSDSKPICYPLLFFPRAIATLLSISSIGPSDKGPTILLGPYGPRHLGFCFVSGS